MFSLTPYHELPLKATLSLFLVSGSAILIILATAAYRLWFHPLAVFPGPASLSLTSFPEQWKSNFKGTWTREVAMLHRKYGPIIRIGPNHLALDGSVGWPQVYGHRTGKPEFGKYPEFLFKGDPISIIGANKDDHRRQRRQLGHAFSDSALIEQESLIMKYVELLMLRLTEHVHASKSINIVQWVNFTTFDIIGDLTFADSFNNLKNNDYHPWVFNFFTGVEGNALQRMLDFYPLLKPLLFFTGREKLRISDETRELSVTKAKARMALGEQPNGTRRDFMTYMLKKTRDGEVGMSELEILVNSPILIGAGSETTATALSGFFFYMGQAPIAYNHLVKEVRSAFADESDINLRNTAHLAYLHACIEEGLRVYPPAAETPPRISPGAEIDGKFVPKGTVVSVYQWATFRNPENFIDPDSFRPQRWLPATHPLYESKYASDNKAVFKPFSHGTRDCIGKNLAYAEMRVIIARILFRFDFELEPGQHNWHDQQTTFLVWKKGPLNITLKPRSLV